MKQDTLFPEKLPAQLTRKEILAKIDEHLRASQLDCYRSQPGSQDVIDCVDKNIQIGKKNKDEILFLTSNSTSQQYDEDFKKSIAERIRETRNIMKNQYFQLKPFPPLYCQKRKCAKLIVKNGILQTVNISSIGCNSWSCPICGPKRAYKTKNLLQNITFINNLYYFLTLTLDPKKVPQEVIFGDSHKYITKLYNHFITVIKRKRFKILNKKTHKYEIFNLKNNKEKLKYVWVIEFQKNGLAHMHILFNKFLNIKVIRKVWTHVGGGHMMRIEKIGSIEAISHYITDYIVKGIKDSRTQQNTFKYFEKRYAVSRSCTRPEKISNLLFDKNMPEDEKRTFLKDLKLEWLYNRLVEENSCPEYKLT